MSVKVRLAALAVAAVGVLQFAPAHGQVSIQMLCNEDSLTPAAARARLEWARACGTRINVQDPINPVPPASGFSTGIPAGNGGTLYEYLETDDFWGTNSYSGTSGVNQIFAMCQWRNGPFTATTDAAGFQKWTRSDAQLLPRPMYPVFGTHSNIASPSWRHLYPNPTHDPADCGFYDATGAPVNTSGTGFFVNAYCTSSLIVVAIDPKGKP